MLIWGDISYAKLLMGMIEANLDNKGRETHALHRYYDKIMKDCNDTMEE